MPRANSRLFPNPEREVTGIGRISDYGQPTSNSTSSDFVPNGGLTPSGLLQAYQATPLAERIPRPGRDGRVHRIYAGENVRPRLIHTEIRPSTNAASNRRRKPQRTSERDRRSRHGHRNGPRDRTEGQLVYFNLTKAPGLTNSSDFGAAIALSIDAVANNFPGAVVSMSLVDCEAPPTRGYRSHKQCRGRCRERVGAPSLPRVATQVEPIAGAFRPTHSQVRKG